MNEFDEFAHHLEAVGAKRSRHISNFKHVFVNLKLIDIGLKPSYLWDRSPFLPVADIQRLVENLSVKRIIKSSLAVFTLNDDIFIVNRQVLLLLLAKPLEYFMFFNANSLEIMSNDVEVSGIIKCLGEFRGDLQLWEGTNVCEFPAKSGWSIPCLYGVILGYPTVMWLPPDADKHSLDAKPLVNCKVKVIYPGFSEREELFSFSHLPLESLVSHVDQWFLTLKHKFSVSGALNLERHSVSSFSITF